MSVAYSEPCQIFTMDFFFAKIVNGCKLFLQKVPSQMLGRVLNTPLHVAYCTSFRDKKLKYPKATSGRKPIINMRCRK